MSTVIVYAVVDDALSPDFPLGVELEMFVRREDAERFIEEVRGDDPEMGVEAADRGARAGDGRADYTLMRCPLLLTFKEDRFRLLEDGKHCVV